MMRYISRPILTIPCKYKNQASKFPIDIRGTLSRSDIYFNYNDIEMLFGVTFSLSKDTNIVWIETDIAKIKYLCYSEMISQYQFYRKVITHNRVFEFVSLINTILDDESCIDTKEVTDNKITTRNSIDDSALQEPAIHVRDISFSSETESLTDSFSEYNSNSSSANMEKSEEVNKYLILAYQHKIEMLTQLINNKNTELQLKDRDVIIAKLQMEIELNKKNDIIDKLTKQIEIELNKKNETIDTLSKKIECLELKDHWI